MPKNLPEELTVMNSGCGVCQKVTTIIIHLKLQKQLAISIQVKTLKTRILWDDMVLEKPIFTRLFHSFMPDMLNFMCF